MMDVKQAYDSWAGQYDTNVNRTRDLEAVALRTALAHGQFAHCLEIGCGTGKNTAWLLQKAGSVTAVDLSDEMLAMARHKIGAPNVQFLQADITQPWSFASEQYDLATFSLVLEHIETLDEIFSKLAAVMMLNGIVYIGELHPFKQYTGSKARFDTKDGEQKVVTCFNHHISDFTSAAKKYGFVAEAIQEYFDENDRTTIPRILTILFRKK
jgi:ubiquinone/menaquinone biosynthesis C-methylase UbiE